MSTEIEPMQSDTPDIIRQKFIVGAITLVALGSWMYVVRGPWALGVAAFLGAIMVTELFLMFAPGRSVYAVGIAFLSAVAIWFSGRAVLEVPIILLPIIFILGWIVAPPSWRIVFPVYVVVLTIAAVSVFSLRDIGIGFSLLPAFSAVAASVGAHFGGRTAPGSVAGGVVAAVAVGIVASPLMEPEHSVVFWVIVSVILALGALAGIAVERAVKARAQVQWASDILPGFGGFLDMFRGMIFTYVLAGIGGLMGLF